MKVLIYLKISEPKKKGLKLKIKEFAVSIHKNRDAALVHACKHHNLWNVLKTHPHIFVSSEYKDCRLAFLMPYNKDFSYSLEMMNERDMRGRIYETFPCVTFENIIDVSRKAHRLNPLMIVPKGFEHVRSGEIKLNWRVYCGDCATLMNCYYSNYEIRNYVGRKVEDLIEQKGHLKDEDETGEDIYDDNIYFCKPKTKT